MLLLVAPPNVVLMLPHTYNAVELKNEISTPRSSPVATPVYRFAQLKAPVVPLYFKTIQSLSPLIACPTPAT